MADVIGSTFFWLQLKLDSSVEVELKLGRVSRYVELLIIDGNYYSLFIWIILDARIVFIEIYNLAYTDL